MDTSQTQATVLTSLIKLSTFVVSLLLAVNGLFSIVTVSAFVWLIFVLTCRPWSRAGPASCRIGPTGFLAGWRIGGDLVLLGLGTGRRVKAAFHYSSKLQAWSQICVSVSQAGLKQVESRSKASCKLASNLLQTFFKQKSMLAAMKKRKHST